MGVGSGGSSAKGSAAPELLKIRRGAYGRVGSGGVDPAAAAAFPKLERDGDGVDLDARPPRRLVAVAMQFAMMRAADRDCVFVAHLAPEGARLSEANVMRLRRRSAADDAGLPRYELAMHLVTQPDRLRDKAPSAGNGALGCSGNISAPFGAFTCSVATIGGSSRPSPSRGPRSK